MSLFDIIPSAYAQTGSAPAESGLTQMLQGPLPMFLAIGLVFYFMVFRPQQQRAKEHKKQLSELRRGDSIVTSGGIIGTIARVVNDDELSVEIAEGIRVRVVRSTITGINARATPRGDSTDEAETKPQPAARRTKTPPASKQA